MEPIRYTACRRGVITLGLLALGASLLTGCMSLRFIPTEPAVSGPQAAPAPQATQFPTASIPIGNNVTVQLQPAQYLGDLFISANNVTINGSGINVTYIVGDVIIAGNNCLLANLTVTGHVTVQGNNTNLSGTQVNGGVAYQGHNYVEPARPIIVTPAPQPPPPIYQVPPNAQRVQPVQPAPGYGPGGSSVTRQPLPGPAPSGPYVQPGPGGSSVERQQPPPVYVPPPAQQPQGPGQPFPLPPQQQMPPPAPYPPQQPPTIGPGREDHGQQQGPGQGREQGGQPERQQPPFVQPAQPPRGQPQSPPGQVGRPQPQPQQPPPGQVGPSREQPAPGAGREDQGKSDQYKRDQQGDQGRSQGDQQGDQYKRKQGDQGDQGDDRGGNKGR